MPDEYEDFVNKFKPKKTTDDCYTPPQIYDAIADYVASRYNVDRRHFVRPFYPGGDYKRYEYSDGAIVCDNPPFSILTEIIGFYSSVGTKYFLFCPSLRLPLRQSKSRTLIACGATIEYKNGAKVSTSFVTNMEPSGALIMSLPELNRIVKDTQKK